MVDVADMARTSPLRAPWSKQAHACQKPSYGRLDRLLVPVRSGAGLLDVGCGKVRELLADDLRTDRVALLGRELCLGAFLQMRRLCLYEEFVHGGAKVL